MDHQHPGHGDPPAAATTVPHGQEYPHLAATTSPLDGDPVHHHLSESAGDGHMMMSMFFHGGFDEVILFDFWRINSAGGLVGSMIVCFLMGLFYEGLKCLSGYLTLRMMSARIKSSSKPPQSEAGRGEPGGGFLENATSCFEGGRNHQAEEAVAAKVGPDNQSAIINQLEAANPRQRMSFTRMLNSVHLVQTLFHFLQLGLAYLLMLVVMTYNTWLFFSVIIGCTVGYLVFGCRKFDFSDASDHCQ